MRLDQRRKTNNTESQSSARNRKYIRLPGKANDSRSFFNIPQGKFVTHGNTRYEFYLLNEALSLHGDRTAGAEWFEGCGHIILFIEDDDPDFIPHFNLPVPGISLFLCLAYSHCKMALS